MVLTNLCLTGQITPQTPYPIKSSQTVPPIYNDYVHYWYQQVHGCSIPAIALTVAQLICWHGQFYMDTCLPFVLRSASSLFNNYANALHWIMASNYGAQLLNYLDDFILVGHPAQEAMYRMLLVCDQLGIPVVSRLGGLVQG